MGLKPEKSRASDLKTRNIGCGGIKSKKYSDFSNGRASAGPQRRASGMGSKGDKYKQK